MTDVIVSPIQLEGVGHFGYPVLFIPVLSKPGTPYIVQLDAVEIPNPSHLYSADKLHVVKNWSPRLGPYSEIDCDPPYLEGYVGMIRSTLYFKRRLLEKPNLIQSLEAFNFLELAQNILIREEDRVDFGKSIVYTFEERRKSRPI